jgi:homotetrameric cytidine deaminase
MITDSELIAAAWKAREFAAAHFSGYAVGAALEAADGKIFSGANVESSSYGLSICAERVALFKALSEGQTKFTRIAVAAKGTKNPSPCGACRQLLMDYAPTIEILLSGNPGSWDTFMLEQLLPHPFTSEHFEKGKS